MTVGMSSSGGGRTEFRMDVAQILYKASKWAKKLRPFEEFAPKDEFSIPVPDELQKRLACNLGYFYVNYLIIVATIVFITLMLYPSFFMIILVLSAIWYALLSRPHHFCIQLKGDKVIIQKTHMETALAVFTAVLLLYTAGMSLFFFFGICIILVGLHAALRHIPKSSLGESIGESKDHSQSNLVSEADTEGGAAMV